MFSLLYSIVRAGDDVEEEIGERMKHIYTGCFAYIQSSANGLPCRQACITATDRQTERSTLYIQLVIKGEEKSTVRISTENAVHTSSRKDKPLQ